MSVWQRFNNFAGGYPFSLHMTQHMLLALVIAPLLLLFVPSSVAERAALPRTLRVLRHHSFAWLIGIGAMWLWQLPVICEAAMRHPVLNSVESICFLITGAIFWWPIASPLLQERMDPVPGAVLYLFLACLACTLLGILVAFAPSGYFPSHVMSTGRPGYPQPDDQQVGGLVMWVGGCFIYLTAIMAMFARWYNKSEESVWTLQPEKAITEGLR